MKWWIKQNGEGRACHAYGMVPPRPRRTRRTAWKPSLPAALIVLVLLGAAAARAQTGSVQTVAGFRVPDYDEQNNLKSVLFGDFARILPDGMIEITNLKLDFYKEGAVDMTVTAPKCMYNQRDNTARSESDVEIRREKLRITGSGFWWSAKQERFEIFRKARVELKGVRARVESGGQP